MENTIFNPIFKNVTFYNSKGKYKYVLKGEFVYSTTILGDLLIIIQHGDDNCKTVRGDHLSELNQILVVLA